MIKRNPLLITRRLIAAVTKAAGGGVESDVITLITRPMWRAFLEEIEEDPYQNPHKGSGWGETLLVYGSQTVIVESEDMRAVSFNRKTQLPDSYPGWIASAA